MEDRHRLPGTLLKQAVKAARELAVPQAQASTYFLGCSVPRILTYAATLCYRSKRREQLPFVFSPNVREGKT